MAAPNEAGNRQVVDDVQHRHDQDERHVVPVGDVDVRLVAAGERAEVEHEIDHPDHHQPDVRVPLGLGVFLGLGDAHQVAAGGDDAEQVEAEQHEPGAELARQPGAAGALHHVEGGGDQRVAAEAEDDARGMQRAQPTEAGPGGVEAKVGPGQQRGDPYPHAHADHRPDQRNDDAGLGRIVVVGREPLLGRLRGIELVPHHEEEHAGEDHDDEAVHRHRVAAASGGHGQAADRDQREDRQGGAPLGTGQVLDHASLPSDLADAGAFGPIGGAGVDVVQHPLGGTRQILVLAALQAPDEGAQADHPHDDRNRDQQVENAHAATVACLDSGCKSALRRPDAVVQPQRVRHHQDRGRRHRQSRDQRRDQSGDRQRDRDAVVDHRQPEILPDQP